MPPMILSSAASHQLDQPALHHHLPICFITSTGQPFITFLLVPNDPNRLPFTLLLHIESRSIVPLGDGLPEETTCACRSDRNC